jgi:hypothetical protein
MSYVLALATIIVFLVLFIIIFSTHPFLEGIDMTKYDVSNIEQKYHPSFIDSNVTAKGGFALPVFYTPKSYKYSAKEFVPNYIDTIYMSSLTGLSNVAQYYEDVSRNNVNTKLPNR